MKTHYGVLHTRWQGQWPTHTGSGTPCHPIGLGLDITHIKRKVTCVHCLNWIAKNPKATRINRGPEK